MKLLRRVMSLGRSSAAGVASPAPEGEPIGLVWSAGNTPVDRPAAPDELVATDVHVTGRIGEVILWRTVERLTRDPRDLGVVYSHTRETIGYVVGLSWNDQDRPFVDIAVAPGVLDAAATAAQEWVDAGGEV